MTDLSSLQRRANLRSNMAKQYSSGRGFANFMQQFQSNIVSQKSNRSVLKPQPDYMDRTVVVQKSRGGFPWHLVIDTPAGHGHRLHIATGTESTTLFAKQDEEYFAAQQEEQEQKHDEPTSTVPQITEANAFPAFGQQHGEDNGAEMKTDELLVLSSDSLESPKKNATNKTKNEIPSPEWPTWAAATNGAFSDESPTKDIVHVPSPATPSPSREETNMAIPLAREKTEKHHPPQPPNKEEESLFEGFGQRPTRRWVGARRRMRKMLGGEVVQTYGETTARERIGNYTIWSLICCRKHKDAVDDDHAGGPKDFGFLEDNDPVAMFKKIPARVAAVTTDHSVGNTSNNKKRHGDEEQHSTGEWSNDRIPEEAALMPEPADEKEEKANASTDEKDVQKENGSNASIQLSHNDSHNDDDELSNHTGAGSSKGSSWLSAPLLDSDEDGNNSSGGWTPMSMEPGQRQSTSSSVST